MRMPGTRDTKRILEWRPNKKHPVGRPRKRWMDIIEEKNTRNGEDLEDVKELTKDRVAWRALVRGISTDRSQGLQAYRRI